jgi:hypothetical protein
MTYCRESPHKETDVLEIGSSLLLGMNHNETIVDSI